MKHVAASRNGLMNMRVIYARTTLIKVTAVSKVLIGPCDQIIGSGSRHFGHYVKVRMTAIFLIGDPSMVDVCCDWFVRFTHNP